MVGVGSLSLLRAASSVSSSFGHESDSRKRHEAKLTLLIEQANEGIQAVKHVAHTHQRQMILMQAQAAAAAAAAVASKRGNTGVGGGSELNSGSGSGSGASASGGSSELKESGLDPIASAVEEENKSALRTARLKSLSSISLAAGLTLPLSSIPKILPPPSSSSSSSAAAAGSSSSSSTTTSGNSSIPLFDDPTFSQTARDLARLEAELPTLRTLKQERFNFVQVASEPIPVPPMRPFPLTGMLAELELARIKQSELAAVHSLMLGFWNNYPGILAQLKFKLCTRWARFSVGLSTGIYENIDHIELLGTRLYDALQHVHRLYQHSQSRRLNFVAPHHHDGTLGSSSSTSSTSSTSASSSGAIPPTSGTGTSGLGIGGGSTAPSATSTSSTASATSKTTYFQEDLLHSSDIEIYLKWIIPTMAAKKDFNRFLIQCKWMAYGIQDCSSSSSSSSSSFSSSSSPVPMNEVFYHYLLLRSNPNIIDRDEEIKNLTAAATGAATPSSAPMNSSASSSKVPPNLHTLLHETRSKLKSKRRYTLHLPSLMFDEGAIHGAIQRVGTLSLVTPLDYENGHPLLNQILKIFPSLFDDLTKRRSARMRSSSNSNIELDRSAGITYIKHANWIPFLHWIETNTHASGGGGGGVGASFSSAATPPSTVRKDPSNLVFLERLNSIAALDPELCAENSFIDSMHMEFVLSRLKQLASAQHTKTLLHLRHDIGVKGKMDQHLAAMRKAQHHIMFMNYAQTAAGPTITPSNKAPLASDDEDDEQHHDEEDGENKKKASLSNSEAGKESSVVDAIPIVPPLPAEIALSSKVLIPPLPAVAFIPVLSTATNALANTVTPSTNSSTLSSAASNPSATSGMQPVIVTGTGSPSGSSTNPISSASVSSSTSVDTSGSTSSNVASSTGSPSPAMMPLPSQSQLPAHKLHILYTLRFLRLRTLKDRVQSILNFHRSVQRKLTLDLYGYGFEDRFQFNSEHIIRTVPHTAPAPLRTIEKMTLASSAASVSISSGGGVSGGGGVTGGGLGSGVTGGGGSGTNSSTAHGTGLGSATTVTGSRKGAADASTLYTVEGGHGLTTQLPRPHTHLASYLPTDYEASDETFMSFAGLERRDDSYKWRSGREKHMDEWEGEIQVDDCCGVPIIYDCALEDFQELEEQLMMIGTYYIQEHRARSTVTSATNIPPHSDHSTSAPGSSSSPSGSAASSSSLPTSSPHDVIDRWGLLLDLWECEAEFQVYKSRLLDIYLEIYEHCLDKSMGRQLAVRMQELMNLRPYIDLGQPNPTSASASPSSSFSATGVGASKYFTQYYALHTKLLSQQTLFLRTVLDWQMSHEKQQSKRWDAQDWRVFLQQAMKKVDHTTNATSRQKEKEKEKKDPSNDSTKFGDSSDASHKKRGSLKDSDARNGASSDPADSSSDPDPLLSQLSTLQIANSPSPFCRSFRVGMLDVLPSVTVVHELVRLLEDVFDTLANKSYVERPRTLWERMCLQLAIVQSTSALWTRHCHLKNSTLYDGSPHREILLSLEMSQVLHDPRAAISAIHSYAHDARVGQHAAEVLGLELDSDHDTTKSTQRNSKATSHSASPSSSPSASASRQSGTSASKSSAQGKAREGHEEEAEEEESSTSERTPKDQHDFQAKLALTSSITTAQQRRLKRLSNLVEIEDEEDEDESEDQDDNGDSDGVDENGMAKKKKIKVKVRGMRTSMASPSSSSSSLVNASTSNDSTAADFSSGSNSSSSASDLLSPRSRSSSHLTPANIGLGSSSHVELVVLAAQEKIKLLICINLLEAIGMNSVLLQQVFESHILTGIYRRQAVAIGIPSVRSLIDPFSVAYGEPSIEDVIGNGQQQLQSQAQQQPSTFILAIMETEETLPIALRDFCKVEQHLRLDPYLFHGYDQTLLGQSPATTPGPIPSFSSSSSSHGRLSPANGESSSSSLASDVTSSGSSSWSARTSMIVYQPSGRPRRFFHRPNSLATAVASAQPPSTAIIKAIKKRPKNNLPYSNASATPTRGTSDSSKSYRPSSRGGAGGGGTVIGAETGTLTPTQLQSRKAEVAALLQPSKLGPGGRGIHHRRSVSAGNVSTLLSPNFSSTVALASLPALKPLQLGPRGLTIDVMEDPLKYVKSTEPPPDSPVSLLPPDLASEQNTDSTSPSTTTTTRFQFKRPRAHSQWQIPSFALGGGSAHLMRGSESPRNLKSSPTSKRDDASPNEFPNSPSHVTILPSPSSSSSSTSVGSIPMSVLEAPTSAHAQHLARAQRRSLLEAQKSRARDKSRKARTQRVQAEREMAEEEKARQDALKAEEPKELCELWLLAFRRIVEAQVAHKHALSVAVCYHDLLATSQEDLTIDYLPLTSIYTNSSVIVTHRQQEREKAQLEQEQYYGGSTGSSVRPVSPAGSIHPHGTPSYIHRNIARSLGGTYPHSLVSSSLVTPSGLSHRSSMTASPVPMSMSISSVTGFRSVVDAERIGSSMMNRASSSSTSGSGSSLLNHPRIGCLTVRTFLYLDGLKKLLFETFQQRQHFNHAQVGLTHAVAGLASASEIENSSSIYSKLSSSPTSASTSLLANGGSTHRLGLGGGNRVAASTASTVSNSTQMLWLRTKKDQDKLDGISLHEYHLDILNALTSHIYILETAHLAQKFAYIHAVTLQGRELSPKSLAHKMGLTHGQPTTGTSTTADELISPFTMSLAPKRMAYESDSSSFASSTIRPSSKYARMKGLPTSSSAAVNPKRTSTSVAGTATVAHESFEEDANDASPATMGASKDDGISLTPSTTTTDELVVEDLLSHLNIIQIEQPSEQAPKPKTETAPSSSSSSSKRSKVKSSASRASLHSSSSVGASEKPSRANSTLNLMDGVDAPVASSPISASASSDPSANPNQPSSSSSNPPPPAGSVASLLLPDDDLSSSSDDDDDMDLPSDGLHDLLDIGDEQFLLHGGTGSSLGRIRVNGSKISTAQKTSTSFLFRIPRIGGLLTLLQDERQHVLSAENMKMDLLARQLLLDIFHLCQTMVLLENLGLISHPLHAPPPSSSVTADSLHIRQSASSMPHLHATALYAAVVNAAGGASIVPTCDLDALVPLLLTDEQKKRLAMMLQRHVVVNGRDVANLTTANHQHHRQRSTTNGMQPTPVSSSNEEGTNASTNGNPSSATGASSDNGATGTGTTISNNEGSTRLVLDIARQISGLPDAFWHALIGILRMKRSALINQLQLFIRLHHERCVAKSSTSSSSASGVDMDDSTEKSSEYAPGLQPLMRDHRLRPSYASAHHRATGTSSNRGARIMNVHEYEDISDRRSFVSMTSLHSSTVARTALLQSSSLARSTVCDHALVLAHPFIVHQYNRNLAASHGGTSGLFDANWVVNSQTRMMKTGASTGGIANDTSHDIFNDHTTLHSAHPPKSSAAASGVSAWVRDIHEHFRLAPTTLLALLPSLAPTSGPAHFRLSASSVTRHRPDAVVLDSLLWSFLPSTRRTRARVTHDWRTFTSHVEAVNIVRALDAPRSILGDRAFRRARRQAAERTAHAAAQSRHHNSAEERITTDIQTWKFEPNFGVWKRQTTDEGGDGVNGQSQSKTASSEEAPSGIGVGDSIASSSITEESDQLNMDFPSNNSDAPTNKDSTTTGVSSTSNNGSTNSTHSANPNSTNIPTPFFSLEKDLDSMEGTHLRLKSMNLYLETTLTLTKLFDIYSTLKLQIIPSSPIGSTHRPLGGLRSSMEESFQWCHTLEHNAIHHHTVRHLEQAKNYFMNEILFRIRHPKKGTGLGGMSSSPHLSFSGTSGGFVSPSSFDSSSSTYGVRRSRAEGYWKLLAIKVRSSAWMKQFKATTGGGVMGGLYDAHNFFSSSGVNGSSPSLVHTSASVLLSESAHLERAFQHVRAHPALQRRPFQSYATFAEYAMTLTHVEQEECIRYLKLEIEVLLLQQTILSVSQHSSYTLQRYSRSSATNPKSLHVTGQSSLPSSGITHDFMKAVGPVHTMLVKIAPHMMRLGEVLEDPVIQIINGMVNTGNNGNKNSKALSPIDGMDATSLLALTTPLYPHSSSPSSYFLIGVSDLQKILNTFSRNILYYTERAYMSQLLPQLDLNHSYNLKLFSHQHRSIFCFRQQLAAHGRQCAIQTDCNLIDAMYPLIQVEFVNHVQYLRELRQMMQLRDILMRRRIQVEYDVATLSLLTTLIGIRKSFKKTKSVLEKVVGQNIKKVKDEVMIAFLDGEFSQRSLFQLFKQQRKNREDEMELRMGLKPPPVDEKDGNYHHLIQSETADIRAALSATSNPADGSNSGKMIVSSGSSLSAQHLNSPNFPIAAFLTNDAHHAKRAVDAIKASLLTRQHNFERSFTRRAREQLEKINAAKKTFGTHSWLNQKLLILQQHEQRMLRTLTELRYLLHNAEMDSENYKRLITKLLLEKKRLLTWRTDHIFRYAELRYRTRKYTRLQNISNIRQARDKLQFSELELQRLGREEVAHTVAQVESEAAFEDELARAENELIQRRIEKMEVFQRMKEAIGRSHRMGGPAATSAASMSQSGATNPSSSVQDLLEVDRLNHHKKMWERCIFQTHVMQQEQLSDYSNSNNTNPTRSHTQIKIGSLLDEIFSSPFVSLSIFLLCLVVLILRPRMRLCAK